MSGGGLGPPLVDALPVRGEQPAADEDALREIGAAGDQGAKDVTGSGAYQVHGVRCLAGAVGADREHAAAVHGRC